MKCLVVLIVSLIQLNRISCSQNKIVYTPQCASGISDWCESLGSADHCKKTELCFLNVWSNEWQYVGKEKSCIMCHKMLDHVKSTLQVGETDSSSAVSLIDNDKVCSMAQLCANEQTLVQANNYYKKRNVKKHLNKWKTRTPYCDICHKIFYVLSDFIRNHKSLIEHLIKGACNLLGHTVGDICNKYATNYGSIGIDIISSYLHDQICSSIHICAYARHSSSNLFIQTSEPEPIPEFECDACSDAIALIHRALSEDNAVENFKNFVSTECLKYEGLETECVALLHGQADTLHGLLLKDLSENDRCSVNCLSRIRE